MGGYGSGRWEYHTKADTVEDCTALDTKDLCRLGVLKPGQYASVVLNWSNRSGKTVASIGVECRSRREDGVLQLHYNVGGVPTDYPVLLQTTRPHFGGVQWWFTCPLTKGGRGCSRRVRKLYLPPGGRYFGCRHCHELTYTSSQESHKRDGLWRLLAKLTG